MPSIEAYTPEIYTFTPPSLTLDLSLGHKRGDWYLLLAHPYPTADSREITRLNRRRGHAECALKRGNRHFIFDLRTVSGWESQGQTLLDFLLNLGPTQPAILRNWGASGSSGAATEVEVLIPEHRLLHFCSGCDTWEATAEARRSRWFRVRKGTLPQYLCPTVCTISPRLGCDLMDDPFKCYEKNWIVPRLSRILDIGYIASKKVLTHIPPG